MKKIISVILSALMLMSFNTVIFAADFSDFTSSHWAYSYVTELVGEGTINGYTDGTFRPEGTVTRAEFVKMIGVGTANASYDDVTSDHWAYKYIISSGLKPLNENMFMPDTPITRGDVAELLWQRAGSVKGITAPPVVSRQGNNPDAISWLYTNGIMVGDDYIDLRLGSTITRAEAATLIIRSRKVSSASEKVNFADHVEEEIFEEIFNAFYLTDKPYSADAVITNGELAMAAARLYSGEEVPMYPSISAVASFEHDYAKPLNMLCRYYLGEENDNAKYIDKNATLKEAVAAITFVAARSSGVYVYPAGDVTYPGYKSSGNEKFDNMIARAYANGVWFTTPDAMDMEKEVTMKELALIVLELDGLKGFHRMTVINSSGESLSGTKINPTPSSYPENSDDYQIVFSAVPKKVYEAPFISAKNAPKDNYKLANSFRNIFTSMFSTWTKALSKAGYEVEVCYYPGISVEDEGGYSIRTLIKFKNVAPNTKLGDLIICENAKEGEILVENGDEIWADVTTGKQIETTVMGIDNMSLVQIIY